MMNNKNRIALLALLVISVMSLGAALSGGLGPLHKTLAPDLTPASPETIRANAPPDHR